MKLRSHTLALPLIACAAWGAAAADYDGATALLCATTEAAECGAGTTPCRRASPAELGAPTFLRIDVPGKRIVGAKRSTPILVTQKSAGQLLLQGYEQEFGWTVALDTATGALAATLVDRDGVIALFGACTLP